MPLPRYGVVIGDVARFYRDPPDQFGRWYHGHIDVSTPSGLWTSALDVDTPTGVGISYRTSDRLAPAVLGPVRSLPAGFHLLTSTPDSGAIDYIRSAFLQDRLIWTRSVRPRGLPRRPQPLPEPWHSGALPTPAPRLGTRDALYERLLRLLQRLQSLLPELLRIRFRPWLRSDGDNALRVLEEALVNNPKVYIFGDRFSGSGKGVHDVHQNQGDPAGSRWWSLNGTWQDGVVAVERADGRLFVWQVRFNTQATRTDDEGHPLV